MPMGNGKRLAPFGAVDVQRVSSAEISNEPDYS